MRSICLNLIRIFSVVILGISLPMKAQHAAMSPGEASAATQPVPGHSAHGRAFDSGPRQKPWVIEGIGKSHFPITSSNAEVQAWFDQGNTLLHSYWYHEAERAFRWTLKLDPEC